jgi:NAD(P)-dependent dehydrogenase (short-subunit alcohol dehydrogenase family)
MEIKNKKILITGGAIRVGSHLVEYFARLGAELIIHYNNSKEQAESLLERIGGKEAGHSIWNADLADIKNLISYDNNFPDCDILINNASTFYMNNTIEETFEDSMQQFKVNFIAPMELSKLFIKKRSNGVIINILDQRIVKNDSIGGSYPISKKSLYELTKQMALQCAPDFRINAIAPGPVIPPVGLENSKMEKTLKTVPLRKKVALDDLANSIEFLIKNESITGNVIFVDCGQHLT